MRILGLALLLFTNPADAQRARPLKPFEFRGIIAGQELTAEQMATCKEYEDHIPTCPFEKEEIAGVKTKILRFTVARKMLSTLDIWTDSREFPAVLSALKEKYGRACKSEITPWVPQLGNPRDNIIMTWCFKTGKLTAKMYTVRAEYSRIYYEDTNRAVDAIPKQKVDF